MALENLRQTIRIKRAYDAAVPDDGERVLVDRVWPRGVSKEHLGADAWLRDVAPSTALRQWFAHDPSRWDEFARRYREELTDPGRLVLLDELERRARNGALTLVYSARDSEHNQAVVLRDVLEERRNAGAADLGTSIDSRPGDSHGQG